MCAKNYMPRGITTAEYRFEQSKAGNNFQTRFNSLAYSYMDSPFSSTDEQIDERILATSKYSAQNVLITKSIQKKAELHKLNSHTD